MHLALLLLPGLSGPLHAKLLQVIKAQFLKDISWSSERKSKTWFLHLWDWPLIYEDI